MSLATCSNLEVELSVLAIRSREDPEDRKLDVMGLHGLAGDTLAK